MDPEIMKRVMELMNWAQPKAMLWYYLTPNPFLGGLSPHEMVKRDRRHKVMKFIEAAEKGERP
jgi:hypothetical protein